MPGRCATSRGSGGGAVTDRAHRYRAQACISPRLKRRCSCTNTAHGHGRPCGSTRFLVPDHIDGDEWNDAKSNLRWFCKSCNTRAGFEMKKAGRGRRTRQFNAKGRGARTLAEYVDAAASHTRGRHDEGGRIIHETPKHKRQEFAAEIWRRRKMAGNKKKSGGGRAKFNFTIFNRRGNPAGVITVAGKTVAAAKRAGVGLLRAMGIKAAK